METPVSALSESPINPRKASDSKFEKAYRDFLDCKLEARRLQGEVALLNARTKPLEEELSRVVADAESARGLALDVVEVRRRQHERAIVTAEAGYERMRNRITAKTEDLPGLLNDEMRNP